MRYPSNIIGIIPVSGQRFTFKYPWHEAMMPIGDNFCLLQRAVVECAFFGCQSIWLVIDHDFRAFMRKKIGDFIRDPIAEESTHREIIKIKGIPTFVNPDRMLIPIYYIGSFAKEWNRPRGLAYNAMWAARAADKVAKTAFESARPDYFYITWPYTVIPPRSTRFAKTSLKNILWSYQGKTVKDNEFLPMFVSRDSLEDARKAIRKKQYDDIYCNPSMTTKEKRQAYFMNVGQTMSFYDAEHITRDVPEYYPVYNWRTYRQCLNNFDHDWSQYSKLFIRRPAASFGSRYLDVEREENKNEDIEDGSEEIDR